MNFSQPILLNTIFFFKNNPIRKKIILPAKIPADFFVILQSLSVYSAQYFMNSSDSIYSSRPSHYLIGRLRYADVIILLI